MVEISRIPHALFHDCIHKRLPNRWRKCIAVSGEYFEGDQIDLPPDEDLLESASETESDGQ